MKRRNKLLPAASWPVKPVPLFLSDTSDKLGAHTVTPQAGPHKEWVLARLAVAKAVDLLFGAL